MTETFVKSGFTAIDKTIGGIPMSILTLLYGEGGVGKSCLAIHMGYPILKDNIGNALFLYTEGGLSKHQLEPWKEILDKKFGIKTHYYYMHFDPIKKTLDTPSRVMTPAIFATEVSDIRDILQLLGYNTKITLSDRGQMQVYIIPSEKTRKDQPQQELELPRIWETTFGKFIQEHNIKYIVFDSISQPLELFAGGEVNFPARKTASMMWFKAGVDLATAFDAGVICTSHISRTPRMGMKDRGHPTGGKSIEHSFKYRVLLDYFRNPMTGESVTSMPRANMRKIWVERHLTKGTFNVLGYSALEFDNDGLKDASVVPAEDE